MDNGIFSTSYWIIRRIKCATAAFASVVQWILGYCSLTSEISDYLQSWAAVRSDPGTRGQSLYPPVAHGGVCEIKMNPTHAWFSPTPRPPTPDRCSRPEQVINSHRRNVCTAAAHWPVRGLTAKQDTLICHDIRQCSAMRHGKLRLGDMMQSNTIQCTAT